MELLGYTNAAMLEMYVQYYTSHVCISASLLFRLAYTGLVLDVLAESSIHHIPSELSRTIPAWKSNMTGPRPTHAHTYSNILFKLLGEKP